MNAILLFLGLLLTSPAVTDAQIGVCYGRDGDNLPSPAETVALYKQYNIRRMRIYFPDTQILDPLRGSNIELVLGVPNTDIPNLANDVSAAKRWVQTYVLNYYPSVKIKYVVVGNEVSPITGSSTYQYARFLVPAMTNVFNVIKDAGLYGQIRVSGSIDTSVIDPSTNFPPSKATFRPDIMDFMNPLIGFSRDLEAPIFVSVYTYFSFDLKLSYRLFTNPSTEFVDGGNGLSYQNLFDAVLDGVYAALAKAGGGGEASTRWPATNFSKPATKVVISETGWPSAGGRHGLPLADAEGPLASFDNARTYLTNLVQHVRGGSPRRPNTPIETYVFAMYDENRKSPEDEKYFGLFNPTNRQPKYQINFS